jgi:hypothetical protein
MGAPAAYQCENRQRTAVSKARLLLLLRVLAPPDRALMLSASFMWLEALR